ncbi:hypothetical protein RUM44_004012 [Polyplax serrata]|uniref:Uncharacterized protein n=1 Tax=Polyplax serrata TaxID=468196 RepID=A0ABR1B1N7_POLSC
MLKNTVAVVAGGAGCLGLATVKRLLNEGSKVLAFDLPDAKDVITKEFGNDVVFEGGSVASEADFKRALSTVKKKFNSLNVLVNCAGVTYSRQIYNDNKKRPASLKDFEEMINVNVIGTYNTSRLSAELMCDNQLDEDGLRGLVINTSGFYAFDGQTGQVGLSATGGAICSMTLPMCRDFAHLGIRVMTIAPGIMKSNVINHIPPKIIEILNVVTPNPKRLGMPEEYAHLVQTIIQNKFLNGETIRLDGGMRLYLH